MAIDVKTTGAEEVRWHLDELYDSPTDPLIEQTLGEGLEWARAFEARYRGTVSQLTPPEFVAMMEARAEHEERLVRPAIYAHLLHTQNTADPGAGRLVARVREA